jgi:hypothetical protein
LAVIYVPFLQDIFTTRSLTLLELGVSLGAGLVALLLIDMVKVLKRRFKTA